MLLGGELQIDAKNFEIFESALYMKYGSMPRRGDEKSKLSSMPASYFENRKNAFTPNFQNYKIFGFQNRVLKIFNWFIEKRL